MDLQGTIAELTRICVELRQSLFDPDSKDVKQRWQLISKHIETFGMGRARIHDFHPGLEWFNVDERLSMRKHLSGKIIILDFFTYCCINCMHVLPDLFALEQKFSIEDGLLVIGVHSAKFSNERDSRMVASAVQRYSITHPVVNDAALSMWRDLGIVCWPTLVMIGPEGQPLAVFVGEGHREELFLYVEAALTHFKASERISRKQLLFRATGQHIEAVSPSELRFPGKVETFEGERGERLVISDSGNNRILVTSLDGQVEEVIGGSDPGLNDGDFENAKFRAPQGVCVLDNAIYVADSENHAIRKIDLKRRLVTTVAGTGLQGHDYVGGKIGTDQPLSSPWDVAVYLHESRPGETVPVLLIAAAGTHQIWAYFFEDTIWWKNKVYKAGSCAAIVGSGREENRNNVYPHAAGFAQPSGLTVAQQTSLAFVADSESSAVRQIDLRTGRVSAVCGGSKNPTDLHDFGDVDGTRHSAKLQHPLGITWHPSEKAIFVADTYNHKIKRVEETTGRCEALRSNEKSDETIFSFDEPGGLALASHGRILIVADTNNHAVKRIDLKDGHAAASATTVTFTLPADRTDESASTYRFDTSLGTEKSELTILFSVVFKNGLKLNADAPQRWSVELPADDWKAETIAGDLSSAVRVYAPAGSGAVQLRITLNLVGCTSNECVSKRAQVIFNVDRSPDGLSVVAEHAELVFNE